MGRICQYPSYRENAIAMPLVRSGETHEAYRGLSHKNKVLRVKTGELPFVSHYERGK